MKYLIGTITIAAVIFGGATTAQAAPGADITSDTSCCSFVGSPFTQEAGLIPTFVNPAGSDSTHNVTSTKKDSDGKPLFESASITAGKTAPINGAQYLPDGTYPFICTIHSFSMSGDLVISGGTPLIKPAPTPKVAVSFPSQKLKKVRKSGKIKVKVKGVTDAKSVSLTVSKGKKKLGSASGISVSKGKTKTVTVKLTGKGKKAIKNGKKVAVSVKAAVKGGKPATARITLR